MGWTLEKKFKNETDYYTNTIKLSGNSVSDTIVFETDDNKIEFGINVKSNNDKVEICIDVFLEIVNYVNYKTNFLNE